MGISYRSGSLTHWSVKHGRRQDLPIKEIVKVLSHAASITGSAGIGSGMATGLAIWELMRTLSGEDVARRSGKSLLEVVVARAKHGGKLAVFVDDLDLCNHIGQLQDLLLDAARERFETSPVHIIATIQGSPVLAAPEAETAPARRLASSLTKRDLASFHGLPPPDEILLKELFGPADPVVHRELLAVTEARLGSIAELWKEWVRTGVVRRRPNSDLWRFSGRRPTTIGSLTEHLVDRQLATTTEDLLELDRNRRIMATAAIEGKTFTAETVSHATRIDAEALMDFLDDEEGASSRKTRLVRFVGWSEIGPPGDKRMVCRYEFVSDLSWLCCRRSYLTQEEEKSAAQALREALVELHADDLRPVVRTLAELCRITGDDEAALAYELQASYAINDDSFQEFIAKAIRRSRDLDEDEVDEALWLISFLSWHFDHRGGTGSAVLNRKLTDAVGALGRKFDVPAAVRWSILIGVGQRLPGEIDEAERLAGEGLSLTAGDPFWHRKMRLLQAQTQLTRAAFTGTSADGEPASRDASVSMAAAKEIVAEARAAKDWVGEVSALQFLTSEVVLGPDGSPTEESFAWARRLHTLGEALGVTHVVVESLEALGILEALRGNSEGVKEAFITAVTKARSAGLINAEARCLRRLVDICCSAGDLEQARALLTMATTAFSRSGAASYVEAAGLLDRSFGRDPSAGAVREALDQLAVSGDVRVAIERFCRKMEWERLPKANLQSIILQWSYYLHVLGSLLAGQTQYLDDQGP